MNEQDTEKLQNALYSKESYARELLHKNQYLDFVDKAIAISARYRRIENQTGKIDFARYINKWDEFLINSIKLILNHRCKESSNKLKVVPEYEEKAINEALDLLRTQLKINQHLMLESIKWFRDSFKKGILQPTSQQEKEYYQILVNAGGIIIRNNRASIPTIQRARDPWTEAYPIELMADVLLEKRANTILYQMCLRYGI